MSDPQPIRFSVPEAEFDLSLLPEAARERGSQAFRDAALLSFLEDELKVSINPLSGASRPGDQPVFVCDIRKAQTLLGWSPQIGVSDGVRDLIRWVRDNRDLFSWLKP